MYNDSNRYCAPQKFDGTDNMVKYDNYDNDSDCEECQVLPDELD
jgi:hypothetical protein